MLFVEGMDDYKIIRRFAKNLGFIELSSGAGVTPFESGGFSSWQRVRSLAWGIQNALGTDIRIGAVYDHDYWCDEQIQETLDDLRSHLFLAHIHQRKEIENYLLIPSVLERVLLSQVEDRNRRNGSHVVIQESIEEILDRISTSEKIPLQSQYVDKYVEYMKSKGSSDDLSTLTAKTLDRFEKRWNDMAERMIIVGGKKSLKALRHQMSDTYQVSLTDVRIIDEFKETEIPDDLKQLIHLIDQYRCA